MCLHSSGRGGTRLLCVHPQELVSLQHVFANREVPGMCWLAVAKSSPSQLSLTRPPGIQLGGYRGSKGEVM